MFSVLERCDAARTIPEFKELLLESLASTFSYRNLTCFAGPTIKEAFADRSPSLRGSCVASWPGYRDRWHEIDVLSSDESCLLLSQEGLSDIDRLRTVPAWGREYIDGHMRQWGYRSSAIMHLQFPRGGHALVGLTDPEPHLIDDGAAAALRLLARHLSAISRRIPVEVPSLPVLSGRLQEVAALVGEGRSNREIAETLFLSLDTVKKYVSRVLAATGCRSRAEYVARVHVPPAR
ncbi:helix-turn-helix transcriptional regulator [Pseudonocardia yuanmonensis]|uniref:helix-turn-helix transcriptional regulator n=1 Tax=Pseudonocardia yuanmonensis TaxID=1095914 RepID=UPI0031E5FF53